MRTELEISGGWYFAWWLTVANMPAKDAARWEKRVVWAKHRRIRARRAAEVQGPRCWYCERPGHDETERPCPDRQVDAKRWKALGELWSNNTTNTP